MPYITDASREQVMVDRIAQTPGELNYVMTMYILDYLEAHGLKYATLNDIVGALECCKQEFIRRVVSPYEDTKIKENGDVYPGGPDEDTPSQSK